MERRPTLEIGAEEAMRPIDADLEGFLESVLRAVRKARIHVGLKYNSPQEAVLADGIVFPHEPYMAEEERLLLDVFEGSRAWQPKQCFYNAQMIAQGDPRVEYAEGYVLAHGLPIALDHGWNFIPESGKSVDVTLRDSGEEATCDPAELLDRASRNLRNAYRGVVIPIDEVRKYWLRTGRSDSLMQDPDMLMKIMRRGFPRSWGRAAP